MDDRLEEILRQYPMKVYRTYRARGALTLETDQGLKLYKSYEGSEKRGIFEELVKTHLLTQGHKNIDFFVKNLQNQFITKDGYGNGYIIKDWFLGDECNLREENDIGLGAANLADLHKSLVHLPPSEAEEGDRHSYHLTEQMEKRNRELKRVKSYIRSKKQKNDFEVCFLNCYEDFYQEGENALTVLKNSNYDDLLQDAVENRKVCHGNYTYHNILMSKGGVATTNFGKAHVGVQILDLYQYVRKAMEKNNWNLRIGQCILEHYNQKRFVSKEEWNIFYVLLLYPEKFWKVSNFYYNGKKSWIPQRNVQKLINLQGQREKRQIFIQYVEQEWM